MVLCHGGNVSALADSDPGRGEKHVGQACLTYFTDGVLAMVTSRYVILAALAMHLLTSGCSEDEPPRPPDSQDGVVLPTEVNPAEDEYLAQLAQAPDDDAKWRLTKAYSVHAYGPEQRQLEEWIADTVVLCARVSEQWYLHYPQIVRHTGLDESHLRILRDCVAGTSGGAIVMPKMAVPELARKWLHLLTGQDFGSLQEIDQWLKEHKGQLVWDRGTGRFRIEEHLQTDEMQVD